MKKKWLMAGLACCIGAVALAPMAGAAYVVNFVDGSLQVTEGISGFGTKGNMMAGMEVTAYFATPTSEMSVWQALAAPEGEAVGSSISGWKLNVFGDTYGAHWTLTNNTSFALTKIHIDAIPGDTMFDITTVSPGGNPTEGTPGSAFGRTFAPVDSLGSLAITATYSDLIALQGSPPVGDLYRSLEIEFTNAGGLATGTDFQFYADTDNVNHGGEIPEPGTALLLSAALIGGFLYSRKRRA